MIPFALSKENTLVSVAEVPGGLACNCICPHCRAPLIAKKGNRNIHHFAHYRSPECTGALESSLHQLAKSILKREQKLVLPPIFLHTREQQPFRHARLFQFAGLRLETYLQGMVPDIILETVRERVLVEVAVHHPSRADKIWKLQQARLTALEIDVLSIYHELAGMGKGADLDAFTEYIIHSIRHKHWLFHPQQHAMEYGLRAKANRKPVKHKQFGVHHHYIVGGCPIGKRFRRYGPMDGRSYANVFADCLHCIHCFEIEYHKKHVGYRQVATSPRWVYCLGDTRSQ